MKPGDRVRLRRNHGRVGVIVGGPFGGGEQAPFAVHWEDYLPDSRHRSDELKVVTAEMRKNAQLYSLNTAVRRATGARMGKGR